MVSKQTWYDLMKTFEELAEQCPWKEGKDCVAQFLYTLTEVTGEETFDICDENRCAPYHFHTMLLEQMRTLDGVALENLLTK